MVLLMNYIFFGFAHCSAHHQRIYYRTPPDATEGKGTKIKQRETGIGESRVCAVIMCVRAIPCDKGGGLYRTIPCCTIPYLSSEWWQEECNGSPALTVSPSCCLTRSQLPQATGRLHKHVHINLKNGSKTNGIPIRVILRNRKDTGILLRIISKLSKVKINVMFQVWTCYQTSQHSFLEYKLFTIKYHNFSRY
jgi:hypothetical protein